MPGRGITRKEHSAQRIVLERKMVTRHYHMTWDLTRCVGCDVGPCACPKEAVIHVPAEIEEGRLTRRPTIDIDADKCVLCGICEVVCPKNAVALFINGERENPMLTHGAFPRLTQATTFDRQCFDWTRKQLVIDNCPTNVISYDESAGTLVVDDADCIRCRQCEVAGDGAFRVVQPWEGDVRLDTALCLPGCLACADICPTRALHLTGSGQGRPPALALADYYCIKCGACMQVCPVKADYETVQSTVEAYGVTKQVTTKRLVNGGQLPIRVERWRVKHEPVESAAWTHALRRLADDKAGAVEIDRKRALRRRDLLIALKGGRRV
ncbi:MAG: 4Fe-4S dicluster domain-containing protein [Desulfosarcinaceae bacterium]|jgi:ferredoxin